MVLTAAQTTTFFKHADQVGIPHATVIQLHAEGIEAVACFFPTYIFMLLLIIEYQIFLLQTVL